MARPRSVPEDEALRRALDLFWERGYDRTSIADLGEAIGVGPSSIYNAFGSKAELFRRALQHYAETHAGFVQDAVARVGREGVEPSIRELLRQAVRLYTTKGLPPGCPVLQGGGAGGSDDSEGARIAKEFRSGVEKTLRVLFSRSAGSEELAAPPRVLAKFCLGVMRGLSQLACDGTSRQDLLRIADHAAGSCVV